jgi:hypothetical protein
MQNDRVHARELAVHLAACRNPGQAVGAEGVEDALDGGERRVAGGVGQHVEAVGRDVV